MSDAFNLLASASRFAIAAAIVYFAWQIATLNDQVGMVTDTVDRVTQQIPPTLEEVRQIRLEVNEIRKQIPAIMAEVEAVRKLVPTVTGEVAATRAQIPPLLERVDAITRQIDPILKQLEATTAVVDEAQKQIPSILETADRAIGSLDDTREQVVPLVPQALDEIRLTREKIDPTLDRVEILVDDAYARAQEAIASAQAAGQQASEGAVKGFFTGIIKLPFQLVGTIASPITKNIKPEVAKQLTEKDVELMVEAANTVIQSDQVDREQRWNNPESGNSGSITILRFYELEGLDCVEARIAIANRRNKQIQDKVNEFCRTGEGQWTLASEIGK